MKTVSIECASCHNVYTVEMPVIIGGILKTGKLVTSETGCPKCLDPDGIVADNILDAEILIIR